MLGICTGTSRRTKYLNKKKKKKERKKYVRPCKIEMVLKRTNALISREREFTKRDVVHPAG